jgi:Cu+-exporting ATPase
MAMVKDPVCGMEIDDATALSADHEGVRYYFCSEGCRNTFVANPGQYAS